MYIVKRLRFRKDRRNPKHTSRGLPSFSADSGSRSRQRGRPLNVIFLRLGQQSVGRAGGQRNSGLDPCVCDGKATLSRKQNVIDTLGRRKCLDRICQPLHFVYAELNPTR